MVKDEVAPLWGELREKYGKKYDFSSDPDGLHDRINGTVHGMGILQSWEKHGGPAMRRLRSFGIPVDICQELIEKFCEDESTEEEEPVHRTTRAGLYAAFEQWANEHEGEQFSTAQLAEQSGFSQATIRKYLKTSAHFTKVKSGWYEAGNRREK
jgi:hypothetical protein